MKESTAYLPECQTAEQVVEYLATHVLGAGWRMTFGQFETGRNSERPPNRNEFDPAWKICWAGLFEEAERGDLNALLDRILSHTEEVESRGREVVLSEDVQAWLPSKKRELQAMGDVNLLVCSRVVNPAGSNVAHIPMMDFRCAPSVRSLQLVVSSMEKLGQKRGVVLESGKSYHYYGFELLGEREWKEFMYRCLLLTPFVDARYIGHRLLAGTARLRITGTHLKPVIPRVVAALR